MLVAERMKLASRDHDVIGRLGGDEFLVLLRDIPGPDMAMRAAERIGQALCSDFQLSCGTVKLRASIGVACSGAGTISPEELVKRADTAMYESKQQRRSVPVLAAAA
ncbi:MAG TPA: GGDEF domain-containing protein [Solirubrobacteraceae bacterium]|nr:GGDEF domain-containing protein [Solirubrobacteraceae bacterium]